MFVRRVFFYWQFIAVLVLPAWLMVGASIYGTGGWDVVGSFFSGLFIGLGLLVVSLLFYARKEVRTTRAVSWADVGFLTLWHGLIVAMGFSYTGAPGLAALVILVGLGVLWFAIWELVAAARKSVQAMMILVDQTARGGLIPGDLPPVIPPSRYGPTGLPPTENPPVIIVREKPPEF